MNNISIQYISRSGNILIRNIRYIKAAISYLRNNPIDICFIKYFRGCSILRILFPKKIFIFDIRSGSITQNRLSRIFVDSLIRFESFFFQHVTIISHPLAVKFNLSKRAKILPIGSIPLSSSEKIFNHLNLIYVGTLSNRHIEKTVLGFALFIKNAPTTTRYSYTIIGDGYWGEVESLRSLVKELNLTEQIKIVGRLPFEQLPEYFDQHNIGVSFVPLTPYFDIQPVSKTFDYLLSGMVVLATATSENRLVIDNTNGFLINDTIEDFAKGLTHILAERNRFSSSEIRSKSQKFHWQLIVNDLENYFLSILNDHANR
jgi:glycosyltransferase involved in cell wall biosynthesis